ncbi:MAG: excinuclease ABC subunit UvrC [Moritella sp.]|uniref:excinuclease ABC subunit UvrC n=1 Tax=Moritella sp. TaxID=78556 RepID=UPI0025D68B2D|nr:excinuclease ABC subunit UvrC [Moritella sp.]NQZ91387.1 excinuclease ABC subunit UvrC [Moritella sp.]
MSSGIFYFMPEKEQFNHQDFLKTVSHQPGVYRMYDHKDVVIYVGKAKDLHKRLTSYFRKTVDREKTRVLVTHIANIDVTVTHSETEALVLEHTYIKRYQPRYNVSLRDDKSYPYILITAHKHPQLTSIRSKNKRKGQYFGPYPSGSAVRESLHLMQKLFPVRQCEDSYYQNRSRPCLQFQLKRCLGPCVEMVNPEEYNQQVELAALFLKGKNIDVINELVMKMEKASQQLDFETAARYRDQIQALRTIQEQQYVTSDLGEMDVIGFAYKNGIACVHLLFVRSGKVFGSRSYFPKVPADTDISEVIQAFLLQYYLNKETQQAIPKEVLLTELPEDNDLIESSLSQLAGRKIKLTSPKRGDRHKFLRLALTNAESALTTKLATKSTVLNRFKALEKVLKFDGKIQRMECFDISHTGGEQTVASCVVFNRDGPNKTDYRHYNISGITGGDDYAAMAQVLDRRFKKVAEVDKIPDILFIDGGKGQMTQAERVLTQYADNFVIKRPLIIGIAKGVTRKAGLETLILSGALDNVPDIEFYLPSDSPALHLVQHIRDESHRFAITGHRARRNKVKRTSALENIPGVGPKRRQVLLKYMGGLQQLRGASRDEIAKVPGISIDLAEKIYDSLHQ